MSSLTLDTLALVRAMRLNEPEAFDEVADSLTSVEQRMVFRHACRLAGYFADQAYGPITDRVFDAVVRQEADA